MKYAILLIIVTILISSCEVNHKYKEESKKDPRTEIQNIMDRQQQAWNAGNWENFMQPYWNSDSLIFIGSSGITYGWQNILENYRQSYSPETMGRLRFENEKTDILDNQAAMVAGKWNLYRASDTLKGHYLLVWKKVDGKWKIVADHSS